MALGGLEDGLTEGNTTRRNKWGGFDYWWAAGPFRMRKLLSQFRLLFPFLQEASILWAMRIRVRYAEDKRRWAPSGMTTDCPLLNPCHQHQALQNAALRTNMVRTIWLKSAVAGATWTPSPYPSTRSRQAPSSL